MVSSSIKSITSEIVGNTEKFYVSYYETGPLITGTCRYAVPTEFVPIADLLFAVLGTGGSPERAWAFADALAAVLAPKYHQGELDYVPEEEWSDLSTESREVETLKFNPPKTFK